MRENAHAHAHAYLPKAAIDRMDARRMQSRSTQDVRMHARLRNRAEDRATASEAPSRTRHKRKGKGNGVLKLISYGMEPVYFRLDLTA